MTIHRSFGSFKRQAVLGFVLIAGSAMADPTPINTVKFQYEVAPGSSVSCATREFAIVRKEFLDGTETGQKQVGCFKYSKEANAILELLKAGKSASVSAIEQWTDGDPGFTTDRGVITCSDPDRDFVVIVYDVDTDGVRVSAESDCLSLEDASNPKGVSVTSCHDETKVFTARYGKEAEDAVCEFADDKAVDIAETNGYECSSQYRYRVSTSFWDSNYYYCTASVDCTTRVCEKKTIIGAKPLE